MGSLDVLSLHNPCPTSDYGSDSRELHPGCSSGESGTPFGIRCIVRPRSKVPGLRCEARRHFWAWSRPAASPARSNLAADDQHASSTRFSGTRRVFAFRSRPISGRYRGVFICRPATFAARCRRVGSIIDASLSAQPTPAALLEELGERSRFARDPRATSPTNMTTSLSSGGRSTTGLELILTWVSAAVARSNFARPRSGASFTPKGLRFRIGFRSDHESPCIPLIPSRPLQ